MDTSKDGKVEMLFLPRILARGHMIPVIDTARVFAAHGVKVTIITTPGYAQLFQKSIERDQSVLGQDISFHTFKLPTTEVGLPEGCENLLSTALDRDMSEKLFAAISKLEQPIEQLLRERRPDCLVSDMFYPWTADVCAQLGIPRILFHVTGVFPLCCEESVRRYAPHEKVNYDTETFALPGLPDDNIKFSKLKLPYWFKTKGTEAELKSYGIIINSFYDLEPTYAEHYKNEMGRKLWLVGPVYLFNKAAEEKAERGEKNSIDGGTVLSWLDSKKPNSVIYVSFGSQVRMAPKQFLEIAHGLKASGCPFIWVARDLSKNNEEDKEKRELAAEQFFIESLVTDVLKTGIRVNNEEWVSLHWEPKVTVTRENVEKAVKWLIGGDGGDQVVEMRRRAREMAEKAKKAMDYGGSSDADVIALIDELKARQTVCE
ncbi:hypothetical protein ACSBR1_008944 [Camellia fascicularis]